ncbi:putative acyltransfersase [Hesseltinella vesiculosa]|uniref:N-terminal methionine N(alpha)-acetyltransferase NatC n=1 Tax=Hesseltinella vesiculosa TaxID=101127 RepID=A0A1X2G7B4_9FUNG|nr:putative acyltransfersase [Hesseltinella vesiculosa]
MADTSIQYVGYENEQQLPSIINMIENELSEPYTVYTYRYFIHNWPKLCFLAMDGNKIVGVIICKLDQHKDRLRGYIAMLAVARDYRKKAIGSTLVEMAVLAMTEQDADEVVLETEYTNQGALALYQRLGFIKDKRLYRYYLNGVDAFRLKLFCKTMVS